MRIDSNQPAPSLPESQAPSNPASAKTNAALAQSVANGLGEDQAQLSGVHLKVQALVTHVLQLPETTSGKVQALRQAVVSGKYRADPAQVAGALFSSLAEKVAA